MATPSRQWEQIISRTPARTADPAPGGAAVKQEGERANEPDNGRPDLKGPYRAFGHPRTEALRSLFIYFNADEQKRYAKRKVQIQYEHLDSDDPESEGFAADGKSFSFVVATGRGFLRYTVHGWDLEEGYDQITFHRMPWIRSFDRDFRKADGQADGPVITGIEIEPVEEAERAPAGSERRVVEMAE